MKRLPNGLKIGDEVKTNMGVHRSGIICAPFYWKLSTDGTYREPMQGEVAVSWNDGTCGWHPACNLRAISRLKG